MLNCALSSFTTYNSNLVTNTICFLALGRYRISLFRSTPTVKYQICMATHLTLCKADSPTCNTHKTVLHQGVRQLLLNHNPCKAIPFLSLKTNMCFRAQFTPRTLKRVPDRRLHKPKLQRSHVTRLQFTLIFFRLSPRLAPPTLPTRHHLPQERLQNRHPTLRTLPAHLTLPTSMPHRTTPPACQHQDLPFYNANSLLLRDQYRRRLYRGTLS